ncbi:uncharacterized protein CELE_Y51H4A.935 [Caenorhabditis elegans]|uniref:Uncharacterized protein n=1 Tax=Caenorhabditis elegans TaxID=6239 RepID=C5VUK3_CAEEL|nr:Uncharacterized protein CELE_Y51H4A.935 [Caenorhabditis elegans]CAZ65541.1 Uncharacterized protein CELE_Y51H4A.935 [Caenorhabditis elegans]|eukprot:NP_001255896.1 Uncharacterized protein CELE_Y51H4A.935 [Caenorhabditis elegans]
MIAQLVLPILVIFGSLVMNCGGKKKKSANSPEGTNKSKLGAPKEKKDETEGNYEELAVPQ